MTAGLTSVGASDFIQALVTEGIIAGVGAVLVFVPQIFALFFFISLLEDSGYMARIAVVMDRIMEFFGLNGKAFIPMIIGFDVTFQVSWLRERLNRKKNVYLPF